MLTTTLFHRFRFDGESRAQARERLTRHCDILVRNFTPVDIERAIEIVTDAGQAGPSPLLVTIDDAKLEILDMADIFARFEIPVAMFACTGWSAQDDTMEDAVHRLAMALRFYIGDTREITVGDRRFTLDHTGNLDLVDALIEAEFPPDAMDRLGDLWEGRINRSVCNWDELRGLQDYGMTIGTHSVTHGKVAHYSATRQRFEILDATRIMRRKMGQCRHFAYPYGIAGSHDGATRALCVEAGLEAGFVTTPSFAAPGADPLTLPRIVLPDYDMSCTTFTARVRGGGAPLTWLKDRFH